jgi:hypothetical protein
LSTGRFCQAMRSSTTVSVIRLIVSREVSVSYIEDDRGDRLGGGRLPEGVEGVARFHEWVARYVEDPSDVVVATETDRSLFVGALVVAGYMVLAVNPMSTSRYRERHSTSGGEVGRG